MWTVNYLLRSLFKWRYAAFFILILSAMVAALSFSIDRDLPEYTSAFCDLISQQFAAKISFNSIHYRFPNCLILEHVKVFVPSGKTPMMEASQMTIGWSLPLPSSGPSLKYVTLNDAHVDFAVFKDYWKRHGPSLYALAKTLPKTNLRVLLPDGRFYPNGPAGNPFPFKVDFNLKQDHIDAQGSWENKDKFNYELYGDVIESGFNLSKLYVESGPFSINLWGRWQNRNIDWKGFIFYKDLYILDINGHLNIQGKNIILKSLSFSVNGDDVVAGGYCSKQQLFQCDANMTFHRQTRHLNAQESLKNMDLRLHAQNTAQGLSFDGRAFLDFLSNPDSPWSPQNARLDFKNLKARVINTNLLQFKISNLDASWMGPDEHKISAEDLLTGIELAQPSQAMIALSARIYAGHYNGRIFLDTTSTPWSIKARGEFEGVDINRLGDTFSFFQQCHGIVNGGFDLESWKDMQLTGALTAHHGDFHDPDFLPWVAKTLQMPTLERLSGADLYCLFKIDGRSKMLDDLRVQTDDLNLFGFFHIDAGDLVSSRMSVSFSKALLSESPIGRSIIGMVQGAWAFPFYFRLSGDLYRMNFQWDNSPLKDKVRRHMFAFVERMIDRRMEADPFRPSGPGK